MTFSIEECKHTCCHYKIKEHLHEFFMLIEGLFSLKIHFNYVLPDILEILT